MSIDSHCHFLSDEDLDLVRLSDQDFARLSLQALQEAQATNAQDKHCYAHGSFAVEPGHEYLLPLIRNGVL